MIAGIVFSRDRACQLDLLLSSLRANAFNLLDPLHVIWKASEAGFREGYETCEVEHKEAWFIEETNLAEQVSSLIGDYDFITFFTDDDVLFRPVGTPHQILNGIDSAICFSLRLGMNTTQCYPHRRVQKWPHPEPRNGALVWDWSMADCDFSYPGSLDGHVFRGETIRQLLADASYPNPNWLEDVLMRGVHSIGKPLMACYPYSCLVSIPANKVTESHAGNRNGEVHPVSTTELQARYIAGDRIDLESMDFRTVAGAHHELPYVFR